MTVQKNRALLPEVSKQIFEYLQIVPKDLCHARQVCSQWKEIINRSFGYEIQRFLAFAKRAFALAIGLEPTQRFDFQLDIVNIFHSRVGMDGVRAAADLFDNAVERAGYLIKIAQISGDPKDLEAARAVTGLVEDNEQRAEFLIKIAQISGTRGDINAAKAHIYRTFKGWELAHWLIEIAKIDPVPENIKAARKATAKLPWGKERIRYIIEIAKISREKVHIDEAKKEAGGPPINGDQAECVTLQNRRSISEHSDRSLVISDYDQVEFLFEIVRMDPTPENKQAARNGTANLPWGKERAECSIALATIDPTPENIALAKDAVAQVEIVSDKIEFLCQIEEIEPTLENIAAIKDTYALIGDSRYRAEASIKIAGIFKKKALTKAALQL